MVCKWVCNFGVVLDLLNVKMSVKVLLGTCVKKMSPMSGK